MAVPSPPAIRLSEVRKVFGGTVAVDGLTLEVPPGICLGLLGPNGAGKSTTMRMLTGQARPTSGRIEVFGMPVPAKSKQARSLMGVVPQEEWPAVRGFTKVLAQRMAADAPDRFIATIGKAQRKGRILIDYLRNQRGATAVAPYSPRAWPGGTVSAPLAWEELAPGLSPAQFTVASMPRRLAHGPDAWAGFEAARRPLPTPR